ncbi:hypothetical protein PT015_00805 [Candidatus Mycobacterium wuenschmannii]|uniref:Secreted protein n=1 Tax=Candidatus Mycobacterium wuenschmannii TaxID=3027808 RepID=A0ABY8W2U8_9MYCO|nr:hypothetical protein [Candidatus Mycobacterium wuenschmannii]WIM88104.1 hypothetical protein PT015_00805 [Candidatus Mycobacterium wuenschmannii]
MLITMTVLAVFAALVLAASAGYVCGRRAASAPATWRRRTSRVALSRRAVDLLVLVAVRRIRLRMLASLGLRRSSVTRMWVRRWHVNA